MKYLLLVFLISSNALVLMSSTITPAPVNKSQICANYEESFITSAGVYEDTKNCYDLKYSILSFKQMILTDCEIEKDYVTIAYYLNESYKLNCKEYKGK